MLEFSGDRRRLEFIHEGDVQKGYLQMESHLDGFNACFIDDLKGLIKFYYFENEIRIDSRRIFIHFTFFNQFKMFSIYQEGLTAKILKKYKELYVFMFSCNNENRLKIWF